MKYKTVQTLMGLKKHRQGRENACYSEPQLGMQTSGWTAICSEEKCKEEWGV